MSSETKDLLHWEVNSARIILSVTRRRIVQKFWKRRWEVWYLSKRGKVNQTRGLDTGNEEAGGMGKVSPEYFKLDK